MTPTYLLRSHDGRPVLVDWDMETGRVTGPGAGEILPLLLEADRVGGVAGTPWCGLRIVLDPLHHPRDFAGVLLAHGYVLPPELAARASEGPDTEP